MSSINPKALRQTLGQFATGVVIVTTRSPAGEAVGLTINSFSSVSLEPPLILFSLAKTSFNHDNFVQAKSCGIHILAEEQRDISNRFARAGVDKWHGMEVEKSLHDAPLLADALAQMVCVPYAQYEGGDHTIFVVEVKEHRVRTGRVQPLLFFAGNYRSLHQDEMPMQAAWFDTLI